METNTGIKIFKNTKVYILLHTKEASGGSELLHQFVYNLRTHLHIDAYIFYPYDISNPIHPFYINYNNPLIYEIEDKSSNILIYPEAYWILPIVSNYTNIKKVMWWLSVDNFYLSFIFHSKKNLFLPKAINKLTFLIFRKKIFDITSLVYKKIEKNQLDLNEFKTIRDTDYHLVQSYYAMKHLEEKGIEKNKIFYLSDYLNEKFLKVQTDLSRKQNIVVYNPKKGYNFTKKIIKRTKDIEFVPIINMTRQQVVETLQKAKVYIDFGNHPGKDRIPREAAILGCCVITGKRGSAAFYEDVSIPEEYKFDERDENIPEIINKIRDCFENFDERYKDFDHYREVIKNEPQKFVEDLKKIFAKAEN